MESLIIANVHQNIGNNICTRNDSMNENENENELDHLLCLSKPIVTSPIQAALSIQRLNNTLFNFGL